jgi:organic radical activating enzyme
MNNLKTKISWNLHDYCKSECSYCPTKLRGGPIHPETADYIQIAQTIIDSYSKMGRRIEWTINGGEPLDMNDIVTLLKLLRENGDSLTLHTNGGKLWIDWWAIEPYVDFLELSYHYWQNPALIKYIVDTFIKKNKTINVTVPMRPDYFDEDLNRALEIESNHGIVVSKSLLYKEADPGAGMFNYTKKQLAIMSGEEIIENAHLVKHQEYVENTTWDQRYQDIHNSNPSFTGMMCNAGIECLTISHQGWVAGSNCNNIPLGNIWHQGWKPPSEAQKCGMISCTSESDRQITKFNL